MGRHPETPVILLSADDASAIVPAQGILLHLSIGTRVSLMPLADARVDATGLEWPIIDQAMHPMRFTSPSNAVAEETVQIHAMGPVVVTVPRGQAACACESRRSRTIIYSPAPTVMQIPTAASPLGRSRNTSQPIMVPNGISRYCIGARVEAGRTAGSMSWPDARRCPNPRAGQKPRVLASGIATGHARVVVEHQQSGIRISAGL